MERPKDDSAAGIVSLNSWGKGVVAQPATSSASNSAGMNQ